MANDDDYDGDDEDENGHVTVTSLIARCRQRSDINACIIIVK